MQYPIDREQAQLADLLELAGSPDAVQAAVLVVESAVGRRPRLAEVVAEILRTRHPHEGEVSDGQLAGVG
ncbi:MAG TPA: hypothetical protein VGD77_12035 [Gemmatimonadaceae bacterium]